MASQQKQQAKQEGEEEKGDNTCVICLEKCTDNCTARCPGICSGRFHRSCIDTWLKKSPTCPVCRTSFGEHAGQGEASRTPLLPLHMTAMHLPGQDGMLRLERAPAQCPECGNTRIVETNHGADQVCTRCGLVVRSVYMNRRSLLGR